MKTYFVYIVVDEIILLEYCGYGLEYYIIDRSINTVFIQDTCNYCFNWVCHEWNDERNQGKSKVEASCSQHTEEGEPITQKKTVQERNADNDLGDI